MTDSKSVALTILGRVQGVAYRAWTKREADARGISGHVRNRPDGAVEAALTGPPAAVDAMVQACWTGPQAARVDRITVTTVDRDGAFAGFTILR